LDGLYAVGVADALQVARARILGYLKRQRVITVDPDADVLSVSDELAERDPALAQAKRQDYARKGGGRPMAFAFISYRRQDSSAAARWLYSRLRNQFGPDNRSALGLGAGDGRKKACGRAL